MRFKRGEMVSENAIGLILAVAVTFVLILLLVGLYGGSFNKGEEGAKSYFNSLEDAIDEVDDFGKSDFLMLDLSNEGLKFYLVYFGEAFVFVDKSEGEFLRSDSKKSLCICYLQGEKILCDDCMKLKGTVSYSIDNKNQGVPWVVREGEYIDVNKTGDNYAFVRG